MEPVPVAAETAGGSSLSGSHERLHPLLVRQMSQRHQELIRPLHHRDEVLAAAVPFRTRRRPRPRAVRYQIASFSPVSLCDVAAPPCRGAYAVPCACWQRGSVGRSSAEFSSAGRSGGEQLSLGRRVALKILPPHVGRDAKAMDRFRREARAAARLHHTNIVPVYEVGQGENVCYYAMQLIPGQSLGEVLREVQRWRDKSGELRHRSAPLRDRPPLWKGGAS